MFMKKFLSTNICLTLAIFKKDSKFHDNQNEMVIGKMKHKYREIPINKIAGL